ncbi:hypothetical protein TNCV_1980741 [Trichonephila clavipes]|nr:hypothetical protein TNCV_1980741 [Trichonephila clavipes]
MRSGRCCPSAPTVVQLRLIVFCLGKTPKETYAMLVHVYEDQALSMKYLYKWFVCFQKAGKVFLTIPVEEDWQPPSVTKTWRETVPVYPLGAQGQKGPDFLVKNFDPPVPKGPVDLLHPGPKMSLDWHCYPEFRDEKNVLSIFPTSNKM